MPESVKAAWLNAGSYLAREDRMVIRALRRHTGIIDGGDMVVSQTGTPSMAVQVAAGRAIVDGTNTPISQGSYIVAPPDIATLTLAASDSTYGRYDTIGVQVWDNDFDASGLYTWARVALTGTPAASPVQPLYPANFVPLAWVYVGPRVTSISNSNITDLRIHADQLPYSVKVRQTVQQYANGWTNLTFNTVDWDPSGCWDATNHLYRCAVSGKYRVWMRGSFIAGGNPIMMSTYIVHNGGVLGSTQSYSQAGWRASNNSVDAFIAHQGDTIQAGQIISGAGWYTSTDSDIQPYMFVELVT